ncbi:MAG TPA: cytochrome c biogenesis protein CcsA [Burkholderiaceae bacterium]|nr:cytochrome c biogenesis protein CcsA [Burkholderiaceae bacterium]
MTGHEFYGFAAFATALLYLAVAALSWVQLKAEPSTARRYGPVTALMLAALIGHAVALGYSMFGPSGLRFGFAHALSATMLVSGLLLWVEGFFVPLQGLYLLVAPIAAVTVMLPPFFHGASLAAEGTSLALRLHLGVAILSYSMLTVAALHALLMASVDRYLHRPATDPGHGLARLFAHLPPLLALESLLFRQIAVGFVLLSATVASGTVFSEELFGRPLGLEHSLVPPQKIVFALLSWFVFGALLAGRAVFGWRGRTALRWTFTGFVMLLLAYVGSLFVVEVILRRF